MTGRPSPADRDDGRRRMLRTLPAVAWMAVIFALSHRSDLPDVGGLSSDVTSVAGHLLAYAVLAALVWWGPCAGLDPRRRLVVAAAVAVAYGVTDEWHQSFVPGRRPDAVDVLTDAVGAVLGLVAAVRLDRWASRARVRRADARAVRATRRR